MKRWKEVASLLSVCVFMNGCSAIMAMQQPDKKNLDVLNSGMTHDSVVVQFGAPISSETENGKKVEIYKFTQGYSKAVKISRALFHTVADVFTIFIWEIIAIPGEMIANGKEMTVKVTYDSDNRVEDITYLNG